MPRPQRGWKERGQVKYEPAYAEVILTRLIFRFFGRAIYKEYAGRLPLKGDEAVLDFGSGLGTVAYYVCKRLPRGRLTCVDISARWMAACRKTLRKCPGVSFRQGVLSALPLPEGGFDLVYCHFVLHDIPDGELEEILPFLVQLLKPKGLFAFREPLGDAKQRSMIQCLIEQNGLSRKDRRITDVPIMGNTLESIYIKL
jgi:SAM-dependent methyltransferase